MRKLCAGGEGERMGGLMAAVWSGRRGWNLEGILHLWLRWLYSLYVYNVNHTYKQDIHRVSHTFVVFLAVDMFRRREGGCEGFLKELAAALYREGIMRPGVNHTGTQYVIHVHSTENKLTCYYPTRTCKGHGDRLSIYLSVCLSVCLSVFCLSAQKTPVLQIQAVLLVLKYLQTVQNFEKLACLCFFLLDTLYKHLKSCILSWHLWAHLSTTPWPHVQHDQ